MNEGFSVGARIQNAEELPQGERPGPEFGAIDTDEHMTESPPTDQVRYNQSSRNGWKPGGRRSIGGSGSKLEAHKQDRSADVESASESFYRLAELIRGENREPADIKAWVDAKRANAVLEALSSRLQVESDPDARDALEGNILQIKNQLEGPIRADIFRELADQIDSPNDDAEHAAAETAGMREEAEEVDQDKSGSDALVPVESAFTPREGIDVERNRLRALVDRLIPLPPQVAAGLEENQASDSMGASDGPADSAAVGSTGTAAERYIPIVDGTTIDGTAEEVPTDGALVPYVEGQVGALGQEHIPSGMRGGEVQFARMEAVMRSRSGQLDERARALGRGAEKLVRGIGEGYNKLGWKKKLLIGSALMATGFGLSMATGTLPIWWTIGVLPAYRAISGTGTFVAVEGALKHANDKKERWWNKYPKATAAVAGVLVGSGALGKAIASGAHVVAGTSEGEAVKHFVEQHLWGGGHTSVPVADHYHDTAEALSRNGAPIVGAEKGLGYEAMAHHLQGEALQSGLKPTDFPPGSDMHELLAARTKEARDAVLHRIAIRHGAFNPQTGASEHVGMDAKMTYVHDGPNKGSILFEPHGAPVHEAAAATAPNEHFPYPPPPPGAPHEAIPMPPPPPPGAPHEAIPMPPPPPPGAPHEAAIPAQSPMGGHVAESATTAALNDGSFVAGGNGINMPTVGHEAVIQAGAQHAAEVATGHVIETNANGVPVDLSSAHEYLSRDGARIIFGGTDAARKQIAAEIIKGDHAAVVYYETQTKNWLGQTVRHINRMSWADIHGRENVMGMPGKPFDIGQLVEVNEVDPQLAQMRVPDINDLYKLVQ